MNLEYRHRPSNQDKNSERPLLILLHGYGSNYDDLFSFAPEIPAQYEVISMNAPQKTIYGGWAWYDINFMDAQKFNDVKQAHYSMDLILADIDEHCELWNCPKNQVNLCGFSQGGILSYALSLNHPKKFEKVACLSSYPAPEIIGDFNKNADFSQLKFYISHGVEDTVIPIDWGKKAEPLLTELNINYQFKEYYEGHGVNPQNFKDLMLFL